MHFYPKINRRLPIFLTLFLSSAATITMAAATSTPSNNVTPKSSVAPKLTATELKELVKMVKDSPATLGNCGTLDTNTQKAPDYFAAAPSMIDRTKVQAFTVTKPVQTVVLEYEVGIPTFQVHESLGNGRFVGQVFKDHVYTRAEKNLIKEKLAQKFSGYAFSFVESRPTNSEYTLVQFNVNDDQSETGGKPRIFGPGFRAVNGMASAIDFGNRFAADIAYVDASTWEFFYQLDLTGAVLRSVYKNGASTLPVDKLLSEAVVEFSVDIAAHEIGHTIGLRHHDALGPIGSGLPVPSSIDSQSTFNVEAPEAVAPFASRYPGDSNAVDTTSHIMLTGATGLFTEQATWDLNFGVREQIKLAQNERKMTVFEQGKTRPTDRQLLPFFTINKPDNSLLKDVHDKYPSVEGVVVEAELKKSGEQDVYEFYASAGSVLNIEAIPFMVRTLPFFYAKEMGAMSLMLQRVNKDGSLFTYDTFTGDPEETDSVFLLDFPVTESGYYILTAASQLYVELLKNNTPEVIDLAFKDEVTGRYNLNISLKKSEHAAINTNALLSFENRKDWSSKSALNVSNLHVNGKTSLSVAAGNWSMVDSRLFNTAEIPAATNNLSLSVFVPTRQKNPSWFGEVQLFMTCPNLSNAYIGRAALTDLPQGAFSLLDFTLTNAQVSALATKNTRCKFSIAVNVNTKEIILLDNLGFF
jgi:hypothetical protein